MKKRLLSLLLILVMTLSLLPTAVLADESVTSYNIWLYSSDGSIKEEITPSNYENLMEGTVSYDSESQVLTLKNAHLGFIQANGYDLTLNLVGNNTIIPSSENARAIMAEGLSIQGEGSLDIATEISPIYLFNSRLPYRQSGGNVTLKSNSNTIWQDVSGIELTGGTLTLGGAGLQGLPAKLDAPDGTTLEMFGDDEKELGAWTLPVNSSSWLDKLSDAKKMVLTAPAAIDEASLAALTPGDTYYFDLSQAGIPGTVNGNLPDKSLHYVPFTYAGKLEDVYCIERTEDGLVGKTGNWPLFIAGFDVSNVSWDDLNENDLIYGKSYQSGGVTYTMRAPSGNDANNEWNAMLGHNRINNIHSSSWVQETYGKTLAWGRGSNPSRGVSWPRNDSSIYYRPVLQPTNLYGKALRVVTLVVNGTSYNVITTEDTVSPASIDGLLNDGDELKNGYYWLNEADSKYYSSSERIPVTESVTLTAVPRGYEIIVTDKGGKEHLVTKDNYTDVLGDGTVSYEAGLIGYDPVLKLNNAKLRSIEYDGNLTLQLEGRSSIAARDKENAIYAGNLTIQGDGILSISAENGQAYKPLNGSCTYTQNSGHVTMPESALNRFERFSFSGGTLTLLGAETETFVNIDLCLKAGKIAEGTELRLVNEDGMTVFSKKTPLEDPEDWNFLALNAVHAKKLYLIAEGATLPPEEEDSDDKDPDGEDPKEPSMEGVVAGAMALLASGDDNPFADVRAIDWFYDDVMYAYDRGLINGTAYNKFSPKESFTRGMLLTILARHDGVSTGDSAPWYQAGCDWAARNGISGGKNPEEAVSREEFALTLYRYAQYRGSNLLSGNDLSSFTDANAVTDEALPAVQWAVSEAILRGDNFYLHPQSGATRAEAAAMLHRFFVR